MLYKKLIISSLVMLSLDFVYLNLVSKHFNNQVYIIQNNKIKLKMIPALLCYSFLVFGLYHFVLKENKPIIDAFILGLVIYMVYELTNKAIFNNWNWDSVLLDGLWGGILFSLTTYITYKIIKYIK